MIPELRAFLDEKGRLTSLPTKFKKQLCAVWYLADKLEQTRDYPGVKRMRGLAKKDLDAAMAESLRMTVQDIRDRHLDVYKDTLEAAEFYASRADEIKEE